MRLDDIEKLALNRRIDIAFDFVSLNLTNKVGTLGEGTQALPRRVIKELASSMRIKPGDTFWEIGCGCPKVAFAFSAAACCGMVIATDLCEFENAYIFENLIFNADQQFDVFCTAVHDFTESQVNTAMFKLRVDYNAAKIRDV